MAKREQLSRKHPEGIAVSHKSLSDLKPDARNANKGTERGSQIVARWEAATGQKTVLDGQTA